MTSPHAQPPVRGLTVVVPARDEEQRLPACLRALRVAAAQVALPVRVVVVLDGCRDGSAAAVPPDARTVVVDHGCVGRSRAEGFLGEPVGPDWWYATTDADSLVPPTWCREQLDTALVADVFVGTVRVTDWSARTVGVAAAWTSAYSAPEAAEEPSASGTELREHPHVHGANLGLRASAYWRVGGFAALVEHEDVTLVERCVGAGLRVRRTTRAPVVTAARRSTRTPGGFSGYLDDLERGQGVAS